jgi:hypothetical protein
MFCSVPVDELGQLERDLVRYAEVHQAGTMESLRAAAELTPAIEADLRALIEAFLEQRAQSAPATEPEAGLGLLHEPEPEAVAAVETPT